MARPIDSVLANELENLPGLPCCGQASAASDIQHAGAGRQAGQQPVSAGQLALFVRECLVVPVAHTIVGRCLPGLAGQPRTWISIRGAIAWAGHA